MLTTLITYASRKAKALIMDIVHQASEKEGASAAVISGSGTAQTIHIMISANRVGLVIGKAIVIID